MVDPEEEERRRQELERIRIIREARCDSLLFLQNDAIDGDCLLIGREADRKEKPALRRLLLRFEKPWHIPQKHFEYLFFVQLSAPHCTHDKG